MRLISYNVNSITTRLERVVALLDEYQPDIVCLQETKVSGEAFPRSPLEHAGYQAFDHSAGRWAGVAILANTGLTIDDRERGLPGEPEPDAARWVEAVVGGVRVASVYVPNGRALGTDTFREKLRFLEAMAQRAGEVSQSPALIAGDMNVCPQDIDVWDPALVHGSTHITPDERSRFEAIVDSGYIDAFRHVEPDEAGFTWWDYRAGHFHKGFGLRIDIALASNKIHVQSASVDRGYRKPTKVPGTKPSDHAPLIVDFTVDG